MRAPPIPSSPAVAPEMAKIPTAVNNTFTGRLSPTITSQCQSSIVTDASLTRQSCIYILTDFCTAMRSSHVHCCQQLSSDTIDAVNTAAAHTSIHHMLLAYVQTCSPLLANASSIKPSHTKVCTYIGTTGRLLPTSTAMIQAWELVQPHWQVHQPAGIQAASWPMQHVSCGGASACTAGTSKSTGNPGRESVHTGR